MTFFLVLPNLHLGQPAPKIKYILDLRISIQIAKSKHAHLVTFSEAFRSKLSSLKSDGAVGSLRRSREFFGFCLENPWGVLLGHTQKMFSIMFGFYPFFHSPSTTSAGFTIIFLEARIEVNIRHDRKMRTRYRTPRLTRVHLGAEF